MATIAVTGHVNLTAASVAPVEEALRTLLARYPAAELTGMSCLAPGADTVFGNAVLALGGRLVAVLPSDDYRARMREGPDVVAFDRLIEAAAEVEVMPYRRAARTPTPPPTDSCSAGPNSWSRCGTAGPAAGRAGRATRWPRPVRGGYRWRSSGRPAPPDRTPPAASVGAAPRSPPLGRTGLRIRP